MPDSSHSPTSHFPTSQPPVSYSPISHSPDPLSVIIDPPDIQSGMPGDGLQISVVVQNLGNQSAVIDVFLDATDSIPNQWCHSSRQRLALGPHQSNQVVFDFDLPSNALPGTYDYTIVVDAPDHYPEDTPLQYGQQLRVLPKTITRVGPNDPTFFLNPATNSQKPARLKPGEILPIEVRVENRSDLVDRFQLVSIDAEEDWLTVRYPNPNRNAPGRIEEASSLEINPGHGIIRLEVHPPIDALAGLYSLTLRLHSDNQPDLVLLDLLYLEIEAIETLSVDLETLLDRVRHRSGEYQIKLVNRGNVFRQLGFSASSREEEELCTYDYNPPQLRLPPGREAQVQLHITPTRKWRRPLWGMGRTISFQIELQDAQGYQLPERYLQSKLIWQARPWWQIVLGVLLVLGLMSGTGALIWWFFLKPPLPIVVEEFKPTSLEYTEGDLVQLSWRIRNPDRIQSLILTTQIQDAAADAKPIAPKTFEFSNSAPPAKPPDDCLEPDLLCQTYKVSKLAAGTYEFNLQVNSRSGSSPTPTTLKLPVAAKPDPQVTRLEPTQAEYTAGNNLQLNWTIENIGQLAALTVTAIGQNNERSSLARYSFAKGIPAALQSVCQRKVETLTCSQVPISGLRTGAYTFEIQSATVKNKTIQSQPTTTVTIKPRPLRIVFFSVNGQTGGGNVKLNLNQSLDIRWQVEGGEGAVKVNISPYGSFPASGSADLGRFAAAGTHDIQIIATDEAGQEVAGTGFLVTIIAPPSPNPRSPNPRQLGSRSVSPRIP